MRCPLFALWVHARPHIHTHTCGVAQILRPIDSVQAIGPACRALLDCNGHGICDSCRQRCACEDGFGAPLANGSIAAPRDVAADCSRRTCQVAPGFLC